MDTAEKEWWRPVVAGAVTIVLFVATLLFAIKTFSVQYAAGVMPCGGAFSSAYTSGNQAVPAGLRPCESQARTRRYLAYGSGTLTLVGGGVTGLAIVDARRRRRHGWSNVQPHRMNEATGLSEQRPTVAAGGVSPGIDLSRAVEVDLRPIDLPTIEGERQAEPASAGAEPAHAGEPADPTSHRIPAYSTVRFGGKLPESDGSEPQGS